MDELPFPPASELTQAEWVQRVEQYCDASDRDPEPIFVGREALFERVEAMLRKVQRHSGSTTIIIGGCPGAGKTAFVSECKRRHAAQGKAIPIELEAGPLGPEALVDALVEALGQHAAQRTTHTVATSGHGGIAGVAGLETTRTTSTQAPSLREQATAEGFVPWHTIQRHFKDALDNRPILLFVDEMQNFAKRGDSHHDAFPSVLHQGSRQEGVSIIPVYAGLANTREVLRSQAGITRPDEDNVFSLDALSAQESHRYVQTILRDYLGLVGKPGQPSKLYAWMVEQGGGWPQHLRSQNAAIAEAMRATRSRSLNDFDMDAVCRRIAHKRDFFYGQRAENVRDGEHGHAMLAVMRAAERGQGRASLVQAAAQELRDAGDHDAPPRTFVADMIHAGMLQKSPLRDRYTCPIPSIMTWLEADGHCEIEMPRFLGGAIGR